jgi:hypothetical protein
MQGALAVWMEQDGLWFVTTHLGLEGVQLEEMRQLAQVVCPSLLVFSARCVPIYSLSSLFFSRRRSFVVVVVVVVVVRAVDPGLES